MVVLKAGAGFGDKAGAAHGMPYTYDLTVPFLVRAPGKVTAGVVIEDELSFATYAHTLASLLGVPVPSTAFAGTVIK